MRSEAGDLKMRRILFISKAYSSDFSARVAGVFQRMRILLDAAGSVSNAIDILFFVEREIIERVDPLVVQRSLERYWNVRATVYFAPRAMKKASRIRRILGSMVDFRKSESFFRFTGPEQIAAIGRAIQPDTDLILAHRIYGAVGALQAVGRRVPVVTDLDDIEHRTQIRFWRRAPLSLSALTWLLEYPSLKRGEIATINRCRRTFVCSSADREYLMRLGANNLDVIPNAVNAPKDVEAAATGAGPATLFFIGTYAYPPNRDAAEYLIGTIFPHVRSLSPTTRLMVAGEEVEKLPSYANPPPQVEFAGFVPDLAASYQRATVVCCPVLVGGGTRIKIIEAAAFRRPIVATRAAAEGLEFVDGEEILLRDAPEEFAAACVDLIQAPALANRLADAARSKACALYDRSEVVAKVARILTRATA